MPLLPGLLMAAVGAGCEPVRWQRPDTSAAVQEQDTRACRGAAQRGYSTITEQPQFLPYSTTVRDDSGQWREVPVIPSRQVGPPPWLPYAPGLVADRPQLRRELFEHCMQQNGYRLVPDTDSDADAAGAH